MFKSLFTFYSNMVDSPFVQSKINIFFYINIRIFKIKLNNFILMSISNSNNFKFKEIKVFFFLNSFELFYSFFIFYAFMFMLIFIYFI